MQSGDLYVSHKSEVHIALDKKPTHVVVKFVDEDCEVPCNPHQQDHLTWSVEMHNHHHQYYNKKSKVSHVLEIKWKVKGTRTIHWEAHF